MSLAALLAGHAAPQDEGSDNSATSDVECAGASIAAMLGNLIFCVHCMSWPCFATNVLMSTYCVIGRYMQGPKMQIVPIVQHRMWNVREHPSQLCSVHHKG